LGRAPVIRVIFIREVSGEKLVVNGEWLGVNGE
jgi:hypothetical protein